MEGGVFTTRKKHRLVTAAGEALELNRTIHLPEADECIRLVSFGRLSSLGFLRYVAENTVVRHLDCSTFRVGPRAIKELKRLRGMERIANARFLVATLMKQDSGKSAAYGYYDALLKLCAGYGWQVLPMANHSKLMLFDTDCGKFVLETSSNLNDAPNWEQFCFQRDEGLYDFYHGVFDQIFQAGNPESEERGDLIRPVGALGTFPGGEGVGCEGGLVGALGTFPGGDGFVAEGLIRPVGALGTFPHQGEGVGCEESFGRGDGFGAGTAGDGNVSEWDTGREEDLWRESGSPLIW